jgi:ABC-type transporter Mla subunit MlaD
LADFYVKASPALWDSLDNAIRTAHTLNDQQSDVDAALLHRSVSATPPPTYPAAPDRI